MNKAYRIIRNKATGLWTVASEIARGKGASRATNNLSPLPGLAALAGVAVVLGGISSPGFAATNISNVSVQDTGACINSDAGFTPSNGAKAESGAGSIAIGDCSYAAKESATAMGKNTVANATYSTALGEHTTAAAERSVAVGSCGTSATGVRSTALGSGALASATDALAVGAGARSSAAGAAALGANAVADRGAITATANPLAYGTSTVTTTQGAASVGSSTAQRQIINVAAGTADTDAANVGQVKNVKAVVDANATATATALGGGSTVGTDGKITAPSYVLNNKANTFTNVGDALGNLDTRVTANNTSITALSNGTAGLVRQANNTASITIGAANAGDTVNIMGTAATGGARITRKLTGVTAGTVSDSSSDAINGAQLHATADSIATALGGGAAVANDGTITQPTYDFGSGRTFNDVGSALGNLNTRTGTLEATTVQYDSASKNALTLNNGGTAVQVKNVADGTADTDAANVGQVNKIQTTADAAKSAADANTTAINAANTLATNNTAATAKALGTTVGDDGKIAAPSYTVGGEAFDNVRGALGNLDTRTKTNTSDIASLKSDINAGATGLVRQDATTKNLTIGKDVAGTEISVAGKDADGKAVNRKLTGLADGSLTDDSTDAVTGKQLKTTNDSVTTLDGNVTKLDGRMTTAESNIKTNTSDITQLKSDISSGTTGLVQQDATTKNLTIGKEVAGTEISVAGKDANGKAINRKLTGLADADLTDTSTDAVTGRQLKTTNDNVTALDSSVTKLDGRVTTAEGNIKTNTDNIAQLKTDIDSGATGLVQQDATTKNLTIGKDVAGTEISVAGKDADGKAINRKLTGVADGSADADAANYGQVKAVDQRVTTLSASAVRYDSDAKTSITLNSGGKAVQIKNVADGTDDTDAANVKQVKDVEGKIGTLTANAVQYDDADKTSVTLNKGGSAVQVKNVADGTEDSDAANVKQVKQIANQIDSTLSTATENVAAALGGGASFTNGVWMAPTYAFSDGQIAKNVGEAFSYLDTRVNKLETGGSSQASAMFNGNGSGSGSKEAAQATGTYATASGANAVASGSNATATGANAVASADNSVALGANSVADRANTVSVGSQAQQRAITNVMAGTQDTDAVNVQQLNGVKSQVAGIQQSVDTLQNQVNQRFDQMDNRMNRLGAMNAAMSTMVASAAGLQTDNRMAVGTGLYRGQTALAIGYQRKVGSRATVTIGGSTAGGTEYNVGVGAGYGW